MSVVGPLLLNLDLIHGKLCVFNIILCTSSVQLQLLSARGISVNVAKSICFKASHLPKSYVVRKNDGWGLVNFFICSMDSILNWLQLERNISHNQRKDKMHTASLGSLDELGVTTPSHRPKALAWCCDGC